MKIRLLLTAMTMLAMAIPAMAQEVPSGARDLPLAPMLEHRLEPVPSAKIGPGLQAEETYFWLSRHFTRPYPDGDGDGRPDWDSNRVNFYMPWDPGFTELRGYGQIFAPGVFYSMFSTLANDTTGLIRNVDGEIINDAAYYEQFRNAGAFTIDTIMVFWFKNPDGGTPLTSSNFVVFRSPNGVNDKTYFNSTSNTSYRARGMEIDRDNLPIAYEAELTPEIIDGTINGNQINPIIAGFDPPLEFPAGTFAIPMIINDEGAVVESPIEDNDVRDFQVMASWFDFRSGQVQGFGGTPQNRNANLWKSLGVALFRPQGEFSTDRDTVQTLWSSLSFGGGTIPAAISNWFQIFGSVDISASVKYHFGREASTQGLGSPTPNPVVATSRLPFSLTEIAEVTIDLFDANGNHVRQLAQSRYVPGNYTVALPVDELSNGTYVARMVAGSNVYSMKVNIAR